jgi:small subunit ribosomal protein S1
VVEIDQEIEVFVIRVDREKERIALGLKQKTPSPWADVSEKFPAGSKHKGEVVNVMPYGAFVKLGDGVEGLVHISEMSWTRRITHPSELIAKGDMIEVQVLNINMEKQEISLGMKQVVPNPWDKVVERYPPNTIVSGIVRNLTNYGAFVEIEEGIDGLLHVSDMSHVKKVTHPNEMVQKGDKVTCMVLNVDQERKRIALGLKQMSSDPWQSDIPERYKPNEVRKGKVTKITNFGVFVELEPGLEGLLHVSELAEHEVENPADLVKVGDEIEVKILRIDAAERRIGLSRKRLGEDVPAEEETPAEEAKKKGRAPAELRGGTGGGNTPLVQLGEAAEAKDPEGK